MLRYCTFLLHLHTHTRHATLLHVSLALAHIGHATLLHVSLALAHTHTMLRYCTFLLHFHTHTPCYATARFSCTCTHTSCYATARFSCTSTHTSCYATASFSCTCTHRSCNVGVGWGGVGGLIITFKYTSTHKSCYATARSSCTCTHTSCYVCGDTYTSSSTDITIKTRNPSCSGWKTSFAYFCSSGPGMMIHTKHCKYQVKCSMLIDFSRVLRRRVTLFFGNSFNFTSKHAQVSSAQSWPMDDLPWRLIHSEWLWMVATSHWKRLHHHPFGGAGFCSIRYHYISFTDGAYNVLFLCVWSSHPN